MGISVTYRSSIPTYLNSTKRRFAGVVKEIAHLVEVQAKHYAPVDEGNLEASIEAQPTNDPLTWEVVVGAEYGADVEFGTGPHIIRPVKGKFLRFVVNGKEFFARIVRHPGTAAQPYLRPAVAKAQPVFERRISDTLKGTK